MLKFKLNEADKQFYELLSNINEDELSFLHLGNGLLSSETWIFGIEPAPTKNMKDKYLTDVLLLKELKKLILGLKLIRLIKKDSVENMYFSSIIEGVISTSDPYWNGIIEILKGKYIIKNGNEIGEIINKCFMCELFPFPCKDFNEDTFKNTYPNIFNNKGERTDQYLAKYETQLIFRLEILIDLLIEFKPKYLYITSKKIIDYINQIKNNLKDKKIKIYKCDIDEVNYSYKTKSGDIVKYHPKEYLIKINGVFLETRIIDSIFPTYINKTKPDYPEFIKSLKELYEN